MGLRRGANATFVSLQRSDEPESSLALAEGDLKQKIETSVDEVMAKGGDVVGVLITEVSTPRPGVLGDPTELRLVIVSIKK